MLLTQTEALTGATAAHIESAGYEKVYVVGGTAAVGPEVVEELESLVPEVERVAGPNRFATAVAVADETGTDGTAGAILVDATDANGWADGFAAAGASSVYDAPVVLANGADLPPATAELLESIEGADDLVCGAWTEADACASAADLLGMEPPPPTVQVQVLVLGGLHYPLNQFFTEPAHEPYCNADHFHSSGPVYPLERGGASRTNPPDCGFGRVDAAHFTTIFVSEADAQAYNERRAAAQ